MLQVNWFQQSSIVILQAALRSTLCSEVILSPTSISTPSGETIRPAKCTFFSSRCQPLRSASEATTQVHGLPEKAKEVAEVAPAVPEHRESPKAEPKIEKIEKVEEESVSEAPDSTTGRKTEFCSSREFRRRCWCLKTRILFGRYNLVLPWKPWRRRDWNRIRCFYRRDQSTHLAWQARNHWNHWRRGRWDNVSSTTSTWNLLGLAA